MVSPTGAHAPARIGRGPDAGGRATTTEPAARRRTGETGHGPVSLGIDIGSTNTKVALVRCGDEATELAVSSFPTPDRPSDLVRRTLDAVSALLADAPEHPAAVGVASMAETGAPLDADGHELSPLIRWNRSPAAATPGAQAAGILDGTEIFERIGPDAFFRRTGVPPLPKAPLAVWHALRRDEPALWRRTHRWAGVADLVVHALTGAFVTDHTLAGRTGAYPLPGEGEALPAGFDPDLLALVDLGPSRLSRVAQPGDAAGAVTAKASRRTGLAEGVPVYVAGHDHAARVAPPR